MFAGAEAFLAGRRPGEIELAAAEKWSLNWFHAGGREQYRGSQPRHEHVARRRVQPFDSKKARYFSRQFVGFQWS